MDFIDVAMVFIKFCMCSLILAWFSKVYLGIHDVHKSNCKYLGVNPNIYIYNYLYTYIYIYIYKDISFEWGSQIEWGSQYLAARLPILQPPAACNFH